MKNKSTVPIISFLFLILSLQGYDTFAQNNSWTNFRGPNFNGHSKAINIPTKWDSLKNVEWEKLFGTWF
jgi:hypothetical protein